MNEFMNPTVLKQVVEELNKLDEENLDIEGMCMKPSQCFHYSLQPVHLLFNTNCPEELRKKVFNIFTKYGLNNPDEKSEFNTDYLSPNSPASVKELKPEIYREGKRWVASSENDMAAGIYGYGETPESALQNFDENYAKMKENSV